MNTRSFISLIIFVLLHFIPKKLLLRYLIHKISRPPYFYVPTFSGRVALSILAGFFYERKGDNTVLIPDYVCNVVEKAFTHNQWKVKKYSTNSLLEANMDHLFQLIDLYKPSVIVGASVFGSSALLDLLKNKQFNEKIREGNINLVLDLAQDVRLINKIPTHCSDFVTAVVSFNNKSFLGVMGGGILSKQDINFKKVPIKTRKILYLYKYLFYKVYVKNRKKTKQNKFDYSFCTHFPYTLESFQILKVQIIMAIIGFFNLKNIEDKKRELLCHDVFVKTRFSSTAAYLIVKDKITVEDSYLKNRRLKPPYAMWDTPEASLYPDQMITHNKGFDDVK